MCGIIGVFNYKGDFGAVFDGLERINYRGRDGYGAYIQYDETKKTFYSKKISEIKEDINNLNKKYKLKDKNIVLHCLHSVVGYVKQPIKGKEGVLVSNCEIYNWNKLNKKYKLNARNDSDLLIRLIEKKGLNKIKSVLNEIDGVYSFAYVTKDKIIIARDIMGIKPMWFSYSDNFAFSSERKAMIGNFINIQELNPRKILIYDIRKHKIRFLQREFFKIKPEIRYDKDKIIKRLILLIEYAIKKRVPNKKFGLLFSGGIDSTLIALILKRLGYKFTCYTAAIDDPSVKQSEDLEYAIKVAKSLGLKLKIRRIKVKDVESYLKIVPKIIESSNVVKVGVALTFYLACNLAKNDGAKVIFSGLGSEEIFAGYERHLNAQNINKECLSGLLKMYERDTYRDDVITMYNNLELRLPFLDKKLIKYALRISQKFKINGENKKVILRELAEKFGLKKEFAWRKKRAAQYGSRFDKAIERLSKKNGFRYKSDYLQQFYREDNPKLGILFTSGKDSMYSLYIMLKQNYPVKCLITIKSMNPFSYMFHTPAIDIVKLQSEALGIPLIEYKTKGEKEKELIDLKKAMREARDKYKIEGIVTGALFSTYQRDRIERIADKIGLKIFSPLWHKIQESELREIISIGFKFMIVSISAYGLDKKWIGKILTLNDLEKLKELHKKYGINVAGEGGEFETLVVDGPIFKKRIKVEKYRIEQENEYSAKMIIEKAVLENKS